MAVSRALAGTMRRAVVIEGLRLNRECGTLGDPPRHGLEDLVSTSNTDLLDILEHPNLDRTPTSAYPSPRTIAIRDVRRTAAWTKHSIKSISQKSHNQMRRGAHALRDEEE